MPHPGTDDYIQVGVSVSGAADDADGRAARLLCAPADSLHHPAQAATTDDSAVVGDEAADGLCHPVFFVGAVRAPDDCDLHGGDSVPKGIKGEGAWNVEGAVSLPASPTLGHTIGHRGLLLRRRAPDKACFHACSLALRLMQFFRVKAP